MDWVCMQCWHVSRRRKGGPRSGWRGCRKLCIIIVVAGRRLLVITSGMLFVVGSGRSGRSFDWRLCVVRRRLKVDGRGRDGRARVAMVVGIVGTSGLVERFLESASINQIHDISVHEVDHFLGHLALLSTLPPYPQPYCKQCDNAEGRGDGNPNLRSRPHLVVGFLCLGLVCNGQPSRWRARQRGVPMLLT